MNYESEFILPVLTAFEAIQRGFGRLMINLSSFIAFHARRSDLPTEGLPGGSLIEFTFFWEEAQRWEGRNWQVQVS